MTDEELRQKVSDLHMALLEVAPGSGSDAKPLIEEVRNVVRAYQRASWATRAMVWFVPTIAALGVSFKSIREWFIG